MTCSVELGSFSPSPRGVSPAPCCHRGGHRLFNCVNIQIVKCPVSTSYIGRYKGIKSSETISNDNNETSVWTCNKTPVFVSRHVHISIIIRCSLPLLVAMLIQFHFIID